MKLVVGLGNPENKFEGTRHNVGSNFVTTLANVLECNGWGRNNKLLADLAFVNIGINKIFLARLHTYMNDSGEAVSKLYNYYQHKRLVGSLKPDNLFVVFDDLDIPLGEYKIQRGKGPKDHNGLNSIYEKLGSNDFWHVRIGIDNPETRKREGTKIPGERYVLMKFTKEEHEILNEVIEKVGKEMISKLEK